MIPGSIGRRLVWASALVLGVSPTAAAQEGTLGFDHSEHVSELWLDRGNREVARDCGGCHDYSVEDPTARRAPEEVCANCHAFGAMEFPRGSYLDLGKETGRAFQHYRHRKRTDGTRIDCRECHLPEGSSIPSVMPVPRGANVEMCATCHGTDDASRASFNGVIRGILAERGAEPRRFRHEVHVPPERMTDAASCRECHTKVYATDADNLGERQFSTKSCADCHGAEIAVLDVERPSRAAAGFLHWDHLKNPAAQDHPELAGQNCTACHAWDGAAGTFSLGPRFASGVYEGCLTCHGDRDVALLGGVHGDSSDCAQCHAIEKGSLDAAQAARPENRPRALLPRPRPTAFRLSSHAHPLVTTAETGAVDEDCASCHRAEVPAIPSRVDGKPFDHGSHLPAVYGELRADACLACHENIRRESFSDLEGLLDSAAHLREAALGDALELDPSLGIFEAESCERCHSDAIEAEFPESPLREVLWFSHDKHLNEFHPTTGRAFTCTDCHVVRSGDDGFEVRVGESFRNCTECHGHRDHPETTKGYGLELVQSCYACHSVGVPEKGRPILVARREAGYAAGSVETHENTGDCKRCHVSASETELYREPAERALLAKKVGSPHSKAVSSIYRQKGKLFFNERIDDEWGRVWCIDCHWEWNTIEQKVQDATRHFLREEYSDLRLDEIREQYGDDLEQFPGFNGRFRE